MSKSPSPSPSEEAQVIEWPICSRCGERLEEIRYLDYGEVRVIYHTSNKCVIGVLKN